MSRLTRRARRLTVAAAGLAAAGALAASPVAAAHAATGSYTPNPHQWYFAKWGIQQDIWPVTEGKGVTVGLVDSGVQASIPDLQDVVEPGGDTLGYSGHGEKDYAPDGGHGTAMAALIAGQGIGSGPVGVAPVGIAPQARILPVHVVYPSISSTAPIARGIRYAVDHGAQVINLSIGGTAPSATSCVPDEQDAVAYALSHNVVVIAGSGDVNKTGPSPAEPGTCAGVLTVGGVEPDGTLWPGSIQGPQVSVAAPGDHTYTINSNGQQYSISASGTSGSSALVSGAAALIRAAYPSMPWYTVDQRLIDTAVAAPPGASVPNNGTGYGIIDINRAIHVSQYPVRASAPNPPYARYQAWLKSAGQSGGTGAQAAPSPTAKSSGMSNLLIIGAVVVLVLVIAAVIILVLATRNRRGSGPRYPGGGTGYSPPGGQQYPQGQYPPQYPPPRQ